MSFTIVKNPIPGLPTEAYDGGVGKYLGVVAHATANNDDTADGERNYEVTNWKNAFVHFFVDDLKILQVADYNYLAYGAGHTANHSGYVQVELCQSKDAAKFEAAYAKYVWILASILYERKLGVTDGVTLMSHAQVSAKWHESDHTDPIAYLASHNKTWANVVADVTAQYNAMRGIPVVTTIPANAIGSLVITTSAGLNLRSSADTSSKVLDVVPHGTICPIIAAIPGWYSISYNGRNGWVSAQYVTYTANPVAPVAPPVAAPVVLDYENEVIRVVVDGKQITALTGITKATDYAKANYPGQTVVLTCATDGKNWSISVPAVVVPVAPAVPVVEVVAPVVPVVPVAPVVEPVIVPIVPVVETIDPTTELIDADVLNDPANLLVLKQMYVFLNKIFGGK